MFRDLHSDALKAPFASPKLRRKRTKSAAYFSHICAPAARNACSRCCSCHRTVCVWYAVHGNMARTESSMLPLGTPAPSFTLPDVLSGKKVGLEDFRDEKALLVMFICRHCPFVKHVQSELAKLGKDYAERSLGIIAISSNDADAYPDDAPREPCGNGFGDWVQFPTLLRREPGCGPRLFGRVHAGFLSLR